MTGALSRAVRILASAALQFRRNRGSHHAAAVAFYSLLALGPLLYLLGRLLRAILPNPDTAGTAISGVAAFIPSEVSALLPQWTARLPSKDSVALLTIPALVYLAGNAFSALEIAVNVSFKTESMMRFWLSRLKAFAGVSGLGLLLLTTATLGQMTDWLRRRPPAPGYAAWLGPTAAWTSRLGLVVAAFTAFLLLYKVLPRAKIRWKAAAAGAALAVVLWETARRAFGAFLLRSPAYGMVTGTLAVSVAFLLWSYTAAAITLYGAEIVAALNASPGDRSRLGSVS